MYTLWGPGLIIKYYDVNLIPAFTPPSLGLLQGHVKTRCMLQTTARLVVHGVAAGAANATAV